MKRFLLLLLSGAMTFFTFAATEVVDGITWTYSVVHSASAYAVLGGGYSGSSAIPVSTTGDINIPSTLGGYPVTTISNYAFHSCESLTSIVIPDSITSIGIKSFAGCSGLTSINIPSSVTTIGSGAFSYCDNLKTIEVAVQNLKYCSIEGLLYSKNEEILVAVPATVTSFVIPSTVTSIGASAFAGCRFLTSITIPEGITSIGNWAFDDCSSLTSVTIPEGVTSIGNGTFLDCSSLTSVAIPEGVTSIGDEAFSNCSSLTSVTIPSSVTTIGDWVFNNCSKLPKDENGVQYESEAKVVLIDVPESFNGSFVIPSSVRFIHSGAFRYCAGLTSVTIPEGVTSIGGSAFSGCTSLTSVTIPEGVTSIGGSAFYGCSSLTSVTIPSSVTSIEYYAFFGCSNLPKDANGVQYESAEKVVLINVPESFSGSLVIPSSVRFIHSHASYECSGLTSVTIPSSVTSIGDSAFYWCESLTSVTISEGVTSIGDDAFYNCRLTSVTIPASVTFIGSGAFNTLGEMNTVRFMGKPIPTVDSYTFWCSTGYYTAIYASEWESVISYGRWNGLIMKEMASVGTLGELSYTINNGAVTINSCGRGAAGALDIPATIEGFPVTSIDESAFSDCASLTSVTLPLGITSIASSMFYRCYALTSITIPSSVTSIGSSAFSGCSSLTSVTIPEGVTSIGRSAFSGCKGLTFLQIPSSVTSIGMRVFANCSNLVIEVSEENPSYTSLDGMLFDKSRTTLLHVEGTLTSCSIPTSVRTIGDGAFLGCSGLTSVTIPSSVTAIGGSAFSGCSGLTSVTIPSSVTSIGSYAFSGCSSLTSVTIPEGVTSIEDYAFYGCSRLTSVTIPSSVTSIGYRAFEGCYNLTLVTIPEGVSSIGERAFEGCFNLTSVTIPSSVTSIGYDAFSGCSRLPKDENGVQYESAAKVVLIDVPTSMTGEFVIPNSVRIIHPHAFYGCSRLTSVTIPSSVTSIGDYAFYYSDGLQSVIFEGVPPRGAHISLTGKNGYYLSTYASSWKSLISGGYWQDATMEMIEVVGEYGSLRYSLLNETCIITSCSSTVSGMLEIPEMIEGFPVVTIKSDAFKGCELLTSVKIPSKVTSIGMDAFVGCPNLSLITFMGRPPTVGSNVFSTINACYTSIHASMWEAVIDVDGKWNGLEMERVDVTGVLGALHYMILDEAIVITKCDELDSTILEVPSQIEGYRVTTINDSVFSSCGDLVSVTIPSTVVTIGDGAFSGCTNLYRDENGVQYESAAKVVLIDVPKSVTGEFVIPNTVRFIHTSAFSGCSGLTSVIIPSNVTSIGSSAFEGCLSLTMVKFEGCPPKNIGLEVFPDTKGVYALSHATAWLDVMDEGKWNNLDMALLAEAYAPCETYTLNTMGDVTLVSPVVMPVAAVDSFTVTIRYTSGNLRTEIRKVELLDVATGRVIAVDVHAGYSGHAAEANVYTFSGIDPMYAGKKLLVQSTIGIDQAGTSSGQILLSNGVTHYSPPYSFGINFTNADGQDIVTSTGAGFAMNEYAMPKNWTNLRGSKIGYAEITVANRPCSVSWAAHGVWNSGCATDTDNQKLLRGYLDDVVYSARTKAAVTITGLPANRKYAVALILSGDASGDDFNGRYSPVLINGEVYSYRGTTLLTGDEARAATTWGDRKASTSATGELTIGKNVMFVEGLSGSVLSITSALDSQRVSRLTIAGIQMWITEEPDGITSAPVDVQTVSLNFHSAESNGTVGADTTAGLVPSKGWMDLTNANGSVNQVTIWDGTSTITYPMMLDFKSKNTWGFAGVDSGYNYLRGYLDDGAHDGVNGATIMLSEVPFTQYSVIVYLATDSGEHRFHPVQVNGKWYAGSEDRTAIGYATECYDGAKARWGTSRCTMAIYGTNALRLDGLTTSSLAIQAGERSDYARGGIAAIQIVNTGAPLLDWQEVDWTAKGQLVKVSELSALTDKYIRLKLADGATLDYDTVIAEGNQIVLEGEGITVNISNIDVSRADVEANISGATTIQMAYTETNVTVDGITYSYFFRGVTDVNWETVSNWSSKVRSLGEEIRYVDLGGSYAPGVPGCPELWDYTLLDGEMMATIPTGDDGYKTVQVALLEGWDPRFTVRNGVHLKIATLKKLQIGNKTTDFSEWRIDDASKVTINAMESSKWAGTPRFYINNHEGLFVNIDVGQADYYLDDDGSLQTNARIYGVQTVKAVKIDLGDSSQLGKTRISRKLIGFATNDNATFNYEMSGVTSTSSDVTPKYTNILENVGDYTFTLKDDGYYIEFIAYDVAPDSILLPEGLPEATGEWLTDVLEASGITSGSAVLAEGTTVEALEAARLLGITPSVSVSGNIATVAAESTFEVSEVVVADNAVSLSVTIAVGAGELPETLTLGGAVKLMVSDTLDGEWTEVTPAPSQIKLTRVSENKATLSVTQASGSYKFFKVLVK